MSLRRLLEIGSRGIALRRRLPADLGRAAIFVSPDASLRYWLPGLERLAPELLGWARELVAPGAVVWDVGANVGVFAVAAAQRAGAGGAVVLVEPDPFLAGLLRRTIAAQESGAPMTLVEAAVGATSGRAKLSIAARGRAANHLVEAEGSSQAGGTRQAVEVERVTLDALLTRGSRPDVVKIDVEGYEVEVLRGADAVLRDARPAILCEVGEPNRRDAKDLFDHAGYLLYDATAPAAQRTPLAVPAWNTLALPRSPRP